MAHQVSTNNWRPIKTAPKDGTRVLLFVPNSNAPILIGSYVITEHFYNGRRTHGFEGWRLVSSYMLDDDKLMPTHWMPLPQEPEP